MKCENCSLEFEQTAGERALRTKLSPLIGEKKIELPEPTCCPDCRNQKRAAFRNERKLYKRKCENCNKEIISVYSPDKNLNALCRECFWSDKIDNNKYAKNYDANVPFFKQFEELIQVSKLLGLFAQNNENSEYVNQEMDVKNCYMCVGGHWNTDCLHCTFSIKGDNNCDCFFVWESNNLYECISCQKCSNSKYLNRCHNCSNCYLSEDLIGCNDCFGCCNLRRKQYCFFNEQLEKAEYEQRVKEALTDKKSKESVAKKFEEHRLKFAKKFAMNLSCEDCFGDNLANCKKLGNCFWSDESENCFNGYITGMVKDVLDSFSFGVSEICYESASSAQNNRAYFSTHCVGSNNIFYSSNCFNCNNIFGCVGLIKKQYCILNKQYDEEHYYKKVQSIIADMIEHREWGSFFPPSISPFGYNETVAQEIYSLTEEEARNKGLKWQSNDFGINYGGPFYEPKEIYLYDPSNNQDAQRAINECLGGIMKCKTSDRPYKIIPQELYYYIKRGLEIPEKHPDQRHLDRLGRVNPMKLWTRKCMNESCNNEFETTYSPDRPEKVYCEKCYQNELN